MKSISPIRANTQRSIVRRTDPNRYNWPRNSLRAEFHGETRQRPQAILANTQVSAETLSRLPSFLRNLLDSCPVAGQGVHQWIFRVARHLIVHFDQDAIFTLIKTRVAGCGRPVSEREIKSQIRNAFSHRWRPKYPHAFARYQARIIRCALGTAR
jgi:hypothetical protein